MFSDWSSASLAAGAAKRRVIVPFSAFCYEKAIFILFSGAFLHILSAMVLSCWRREAAANFAFLCAISVAKT